MNASTEETLWKSSRHATQFNTPNSDFPLLLGFRCPCIYLLSRLFTSSSPPKHLLWSIHIHDLTGSSDISHPWSCFCACRDVSRQKLIKTSAWTPVPEFAQSRCALQDWSSYPKHTSLEKEREEGSDRGGWMYRWFVSQEWVNVSAVPSELELHRPHCQRIFSCNLQTWNNRKTVSFAFSVTIMRFKTFFFF